MIFRNAKFQNFRLLRDLELDFSTDVDRKLTVIRAENETGKTTLINGLQWILFGEEALPRPASAYRLHPVDWSGPERTVEIEGSLEFEHTYERATRSGGWNRQTEVYLARRRAVEEVNGDTEWSRRGTEFQLYRRTEAGWDRVAGDSQLELKQMLGSNFRELFFTDGDRALSFITSEMSVGDKRKLVQGAIRDMLGFGMLKSARTHVERAISEIRSDVKGAGGEDELSAKAQAIAEVEGRIEAAEAAQADAEGDVQRIAGELAALDTKIEAALRHGDREELLGQLKAARTAVERTRGELDRARSDHSELFRRAPLGYALAASVVHSAQAHLNQLSNEGRLPRSATPILRERLALGQCICARPLPLGSPERAAVERMVAEQETRSVVDDRLTTLRYAANTAVQELESASAWRHDLSRVVELRERIEERLEAAEAEQKRLEAAVDAVPDTDLALLRRTHRDVMRMKDEAQKRRHLSEEKANRLKVERQQLEAEYQVMVRRSRAAARVRSRLQAAEDVRTVLLGAYDTIERHEIPAVSRAMNEYFLAMIGGDPQRTIIQEAAVTENYDIVVYGPMRRVLDPDTDLNGASRRALTLAFILALSEVSGVKAPNVIDTPLGMMSPQIKRAAVETAVAHSDQLVLLLTRSEIRDIEDLVDRFAGACVTLSNSAHYPKWLRNDPGRRYFASIRCDCTHRQYCAVCERTGDNERSELLRRAS